MTSHALKFLLLPASITATSYTIDDLVELFVERLSTIITTRTRFGAGEIVEEVAYPEGCVYSRAFPDVPGSVSSSYEGTMQ